MIFMQYVVYIILLLENTVKNTPVEKGLFFWFIHPNSSLFSRYYLLTFVKNRNIYQNFAFSARALFRTGSQTHIDFTFGVC